MVITSKEVLEEVEEGNGLREKEVREKNSRAVPQPERK